MSDRYRKKPVIIEARRVPFVWDVDGRIAFEEWINTHRGDRRAKWIGEWMEIETLEGVMRADVGDFVIVGVQGEIYPCKPDIFKQTYEPVADSAGGGA